MVYRFLADALVVFHSCFVLFVIFGGLVVYRRAWVALLHLPAAAWGVIVEWSGWMCPLTPLENHLRELGASSTYTGGFVDHYIMPVLYPDGLTRNIQFVLGAGILAINLTMYTLTIRRVMQKRAAAKTPQLPPDPRMSAVLGAVQETP